MEEEKPKVIIIGNGSIGANITKNFGVTDMQTYKDFEIDEVTSSPPLNKVFTIENHRTDLDCKSGREKRRQRRKQQRKNK